MLGIPILVFFLTLLAVLAGYFLLGPSRAEKAEVKKRLSLLELRNLQASDIPEYLKTELLSNVPSLNRILSHLNLAVRIDRRLKQADLEINVGTFILLSIVLLVAGPIAGMVFHWPLVVSLVIGMLLSCIPNTVVNFKRRLRIKKFLSHFPDALEMFARSLRAGHSFTGAIQLVAQEMPPPIGPEFQKVFDEQNLGIPLRQALVGLTDRIDSLDVKFFVTAILIQRETGGNLAEIIDKISHVIRERFRIQGQLKIFTAQARLTGGILAFLPIAVGLLIGMINPLYIRPLWAERTGRILLCIAGAMQITGMLVIRKIIRIKI